MSIYMVGLGMDPDALPESHMDVIDQAQLLVGAPEDLAAFDDHPAEKLTLRNMDMTAVLQEIASRDAEETTVAVLCPGDPMFFGFGQRFVEEFGPEEVRLLPNVTVLQYAASTMKIPWQDVVPVMLPAPDEHRQLFAALLANDWVAAFTNQQVIPASLAQALLDKGADNYDMWVLENLGTENQRWGKYSLEEAARQHFSRHNLALFERTRPPASPLSLGIPDEQFHTDRSGITKWSVRAAALAALRPAPNHLMWDLGAGCGAVAVEASSLIRRGLVIVVEKNADRVALIRKNVRRFGALLVEVVHGSMPRCLDDLPDPDRVYVGGGLGQNNSVLECACQRLKPGGRIVVQCSRLNTLEQCRRLLSEYGWAMELSMLQCSETAHIPSDLRLVGAEPVFLVAAEKPE